MAERRELRPTTASAAAPIGEPRHAVSRYVPGNLTAALASAEVAHTPTVTELVRFALHRRAARSRATADEPPPRSTATSSSSLVGDVQQLGAR